MKKKASGEDLAGRREWAEGLGLKHAEGMGSLPAPETQETVHA